MKALLTLIEKTAFLKGVDVLSGIPTEALVELAARARELHFETGDVLYQEGEANRGTFLVVEGSLEQRKGRALVRVVHPGDGVGELWLSSSDPHQYTVVASEHSHVLNFTVDDVIDGMLDHPEFGVAMVQSFARILHEQTGRMLELESLVARLHATLAQAGLEPPDPRTLDATDGVPAPAPPDAH